jgi:hypothetical protein
VDLLVNFGVKGTDPAPDGFDVTQGRRFLLHTWRKSTGGCQ